MFVPTPSADLKEFRPFFVVLSFHLGLCNRIYLVVFKKRRESGTLKTELLPQASPRSPPPPAPVPSRNLLPTSTGTGTGTAWAVPTPCRASPRATAPAGTQPPEGAAGPRGSQEALQGWAGVAPGVRWDPQTQHVTMQNLPTVPQDGAAPAPGAAWPRRVSTQSHRVVQDQHLELQDHAGSAPSATEPCRTCQQRCRAVQDQHPAPQGHGGSAPSATGPCRTRK